MTIELKPCPFCGTVPRHFGGHYVFCAECSAEGPYASDEAAAAWNTRADAALRREREPVKIKQDSQSKYKVVE